MPNDNLHGIWVKWDSVKAQLLAEARGELSKTGTWGEGAISDVQTETLLDRVTNTLFTLGISVKDQVVSIANLATEKFSANNAKIKIADIEKLQMVDQKTGETYCSWISDGQWQKVKGDCATADVNSAAIITDTQAIISQTAQAVEQAKDAAEKAQEAANNALETSQQAQQAVSENVKEAVQQAATQAINKKVENQIEEKVQQEVQSQISEIQPEAPVESSNEKPEPVAPEIQPAPETEAPAPTSMIWNSIKYSTAGILEAMWRFAKWPIEILFKK